MRWSPIITFDLYCQELTFSWWWLLKALSAICKAKAAFGALDPRYLKTLCAIFFLLAQNQAWFRRVLCHSQISNPRLARWAAIRYLCFGMKGTPQSYCYLCSEEMHTKNMIRIAQSVPDLHSCDFLFVLLILCLCSYSCDLPGNWQNHLRDSTNGSKQICCIWRVI